mmetsp:Transcript_42177/g.70364  ORF Transcript_42177/g.70364 Transcript_42177/m.70364 type:complete len:394 (+) Transcript_42177:580-1761(+)
MHDIFGRERHRDQKSDMGGVGSFDKASMTLYVGGLPINHKGVEAAVAREFGEWGVIARVTYLKQKGCCFVKYTLRASAEFAKEAMIGQTIALSSPCSGATSAAVSSKPGAKRRRSKLSSASSSSQRTGILNIRWATDDPNPRAIRREENLRRQQLDAKLRSLQRRAGDPREANKHSRKQHQQQHRQPPQYHQYIDKNPHTQIHCQQFYSPNPPTSHHAPWPHSTPAFPSNERGYHAAAAEPSSASSFPSSLEYPDTSGQYPEAATHHTTPQAGSRVGDEEPPPPEPSDDVIEYVSEEGGDASAISIITPCLHLETDTGKDSGAGGKKKRKRITKTKTGEPPSSPSLGAGTTLESSRRKEEKNGGGATRGQEPGPLVGLLGNYGSSSDDENGDE